MLTQETVKHMYSYDPTTGVVLRLISTNPKHTVGEEVGSISKGYRNVCINYKNYPLHRIIWLYMTGSLPNKIIDHINGNGIDNRWVVMIKLNGRHKNLGYYKCIIEAIAARKAANIQYGFHENHGKALPIKQAA